MTTYGVTPDGYVLKTFEVVRSEVQARARTLLRLPNLDLSDPAGFVASLYLPLTEQIAELHALAEIVYNAPDPRRSTGQSYAAVAQLRGVTRKRPERGTHPGVEMTFDASVPDTIQRGAIRFHPEGDPSNAWINVDALSVTEAGVRVIAVESELPGSSKFLNAEAPIEILDGPSQLTLIEIPSDATSGTDLESETAWRQRSEKAIRSEQTRVGSALEEIGGVLSARVVETPGFIRAYVDDGGEVSDDVIAQAILDSKAQGIVTLGSESGTATDADDGSEVTIYFERVTLVPVYVEIELDGAASVTAIRNAIRAAGPLRSGDPVKWSKLLSAANAIEGVDDVISLKIGRAPSPALSVNLSMGGDERADIDTADILVTFA